jgi:hypothetical protein
MRNSLPAGRWHRGNVAQPRASVAGRRFSLHSSQPCHQDEALASIGGDAYSPFLVLSPKKVVLTILERLHPSNQLGIYARILLNWTCTLHIFAGKRKAIVGAFSSDIVRRKLWMTGNQDREAPFLSLWEWI